MALNHLKKKSFALKFEEQIKADITAAETAMVAEGLTEEETAEVIEFVNSEAFETYKASKANDSSADAGADKAPKKGKAKADPDDKQAQRDFEKWEIRTTFKTKKDGARVTDDEGNYIVEKEEKVKFLRNVKTSIEKAAILNLRSHDRNTKLFLKD